MSIYVRKNRYIKVKGMDKGEWVLIGENTVVAYLPPHFNHHEVKRVLERMDREAETIMGDLNCCGGSKKRTLEGWIQAREYQDIGKEEHTHDWGLHRCRIDRVLTKGQGKPWYLKQLLGGKKRRIHIR